MWVEDVEWVRTVRGVRGVLSLSPPPLFTPHIFVIINLAQASIARNRSTCHKRVVIKACARCRRCCHCRFSAVSWAVLCHYGYCYYCGLLILVLLANSGFIFKGIYYPHFSSGTGTGVSPPTRSSRGFQGVGQSSPPLLACQGLGGPGGRRSRSRTEVSGPILAGRVTRGHPSDTVPILSALTLETGVLSPATYRLRIPSLPQVISRKR